MAKKKSTTITFEQFKNQNQDPSKGPVTYDTYKQQNTDPARGPVSYSTYQKLQAHT